MWHAVDGMGWWMLWGSVWFVIFWGLIIWTIVRVSLHSNSSPQEPGPLDLARIRYARGEISREEFEQLRRDLA